jgi:hypothetical protein
MRSDETLLETHLACGRSRVTLQRSHESLVRPHETQVRFDQGLG